MKLDNAVTVIQAGPVKMVSTKFGSRQVQDVMVHVAGCALTISAWEMDEVAAGERVLLGTDRFHTKLTIARKA